jgi:hypothetical protein
LNPHGFCPLPPQDSVSTKFHHFRTQLLLLAARATFARRTSYFCSPHELLLLAATSGRRRGLCLLRHRSLAGGNTFHHRRRCSSAEQESKAKGSKHKNNRCSHGHFVQKGRCSCASEDGLARTAKSSPHTGSFALLKQHDHDQSDTDNNMKKDEYKLHWFYLCLTSPFGVKK